MSKEYNSLLLVEGKSEEKAIKEFFNKWDCAINFEISNENSITKLKPSLKTHLKSTNTLKKLWIIMDADKSYDAAWQSIRDILERSGKYVPPKIMPKSGLILLPKDSNDIIVGVWIMPNNQNIGMLEDFMMSIIPEEDKLLIESEDVITTLETKGIQKYKSVHRAKAKFHTWLAWQDEPGESINVAIRKNLFNRDMDLYNAFKVWIMELNY